MGLIIELEFGEGIRRVELVYGLTPSTRVVTFMDGSPVEPGSYEDRFVKDYKEHGLDAIMNSRVDPLRRHWHDEWVEAFVEAVQEQGPSAYGEHLNELDIAKMIYEYAYESDDYDYIWHVIKFEREETVIGWMIRDLIDAIDTKGYHHPGAGNIARAMVGYIRTEDIKIELDESVIESYGRRTIQHAEYAISVRGHEIANWTEEAHYEIGDPLTFSGYVDEDYFMYPEHGGDIKSNAIDFLSEFDLSLPEPSKPEPPDHPEPIEDGEYGVIHEYDEDFSMMPDLAGTWEAATFGSAMDAMNAVSLAKEIYENISFPTHVTLTPVRKLSPEEAEYAEKNFDYMVAYAAMSGEPAPKEWQREWKQPLIDENEV